MTRPTGVSTSTPVAELELEERRALEAAAAPIATFDDLLTRHQTELYRLALHLTRNHPDADDLYQETLIKAYKAFDRLDSTANHRAWLYRIATNTFLSDRRKRGRIDSLDAQTNLVIPARETDQAAGLDARAQLKEVEAFITRLPPKQRIALVLRKYHDLSYADIGETLKCSESAARANVHQALRKLRDHFGVGAHPREWQVVARPLPTPMRSYDLAAVD